ncbi:MAG: toll/interleukin-1 receptor domain-containing protein [Bacteroidia bacterium]|nr:toll/interleukin-1 receptor domain-containing protein [Bacteroidia bacterium]
MKDIFISHSSKDEDLVKSFINKILVAGLNIDKERIFCTAAENMGIKSGNDFRKEVKNRLIQSKYIIQIITTNYKNSEICLNEMGAAWALTDCVVPFILDPIRYDNVGIIHSTTQLLRINVKKDLLRFKDDHKELYPESKFSSEYYDAQINEFLSDFIPGTNLMRYRTASLEISSESINSYFRRYLEKDTDRTSLILQAQPTLSDCREVFLPSYFNEVYSSYGLVFNSILKDGDEFRRGIANRQEVSIIPVTYEDIQDVNEKSKLKISFGASINRGVVFYQIKFREYNQDSGYTLNYWCYINNRWVYFPKPYRIISTIDDIREDKSLKLIVKVLKFFGVHKDIRKYKGRSEMLVSHVIGRLSNDELN